MGSKSRKPAVIVVLLLVAGVGGVIVYDAVRQASASSDRERPSFDGPPPDAAYINDTPTTMLTAVAARKGAAREEAVASLVGVWVPAEGWEGVAEAIDERSDGVELRLYQYSATIIGGGYWIIATVGDRAGVEKGDTVRVQGRIADVTITPGAATVTYRIVLDSGRVIWKGRT